MKVWVRNFPVQNLLLFSISHQFQTALEVLECLLIFTSEDGRHSTAEGMDIVRHILHNHIKVLYSCLNPASPANITKAVLRVLTAMVTQGTAAAREVQSVFDFSLRALSALPHRRDNKVSFKRKY